jgi:hypothetical protein
MTPSPPDQAWETPLLPLAEGIAVLAALFSIVAIFLAALSYQVATGNSGYEAVLWGGFSTAFLAMLGPPTAIRNPESIAPRWRPAIARMADYLRKGRRFAVYLFMAGAALVYSAGIAHRLATNELEPVFLLLAFAIIGAAITVSIAGLRMRDRLWDKPPE